MENIKLAAIIAEYIRKGYGINSTVEYYSNSCSPLVIYAVPNTSDATEKGFSIGELWENKDSFDTILNFAYFLIGK